MRLSPWFCQYIAKFQLTYIILFATLLILCVVVHHDVYCRWSCSLRYCFCSSTSVRLDGSLYTSYLCARENCATPSRSFFLRIKYHTIFFIPLLLINIFYNLFAQYLAPREIFLYLSALEWFSIGPRVPRNSKYYIFNNDKNTRNLYASYGYLINNKILQ